MILSKCSEQGCGVLTIGPRCVEHDTPVTRTFTRGRPFGASVPPARVDGRVPRTAASAQRAAVLVSTR